MYFIIEHPTRGVLQTDMTDGGMPRFSWSKGRGHEDNARYFQLRRAIADWSGMPDGCQVRSSEPRKSDGPMGDDHWPVVWPVQS